MQLSGDSGPLLRHRPVGLILSLAFHPGRPLLEVVAPDPSDIADIEENDHDGRVEEERSRSRGELVIQKGHSGQYAAQRHQRGDNRRLLARCIQARAVEANQECEIARVEVVEGLLCDKGNQGPHQGDRRDDGEHRERSPPSPQQWYRDGRE